jgi:hypothetical protein
MSETLIAQQAAATFEALRTRNVSRLARWHDPDSEPWTGADWSNAMCGEAGEAANVVKKLGNNILDSATIPEDDGFGEHVDARR